MIQTDVALPDHPDIEVMHIGPDQMPYVCICENMDHRVDCTISWHYHQYFEVTYVAEGSMECRTPDQVLTVNKGEAVFINTGVLHMYQKTSVCPCVLYAHIFDSTFLTGTLSSQIYQKYIYPIAKNRTVQLQPIRPDNLHQNRMLSSLQTMVELARKEPFGYEFQLQTQLSEFWCQLLTLADLRSPGPDRSDSDIQRIKAMLQFIHENYPQRLTLKDIADAALVSERECSRCFQRCLRESAVSYLNKYRIRVAARLLLEGHDSIRNIGRSCGFHSDSYFCKQFQDMLGCSPREYRKRSSAVLASRSPQSVV